MASEIRILAGRIDRRAGSHVYHYELSRRLAARGHRVSLVCFETETRLDPGKAVDVQTVSLPEWQHTPILWRATSLLQLWDVGRQVRHLPMGRVDVVIAGEHLLMKAHARRFPRTPMIYLPHSLDVENEIASYGMEPCMEWISTRVYRHLQVWALNHAGCTVRFTESACEVFRQRYGSRIRSRLVVNPMGVDIPRRAARPRLDSSQPVRLLWVGQLIARKRIEAALDALAAVRSANWIFDVVGDGLERERLQNRAAQLDLAGKVRFHGFQDEPAVWYESADLLLFPSALENSPVTMLEAMSHGVPCLAMRADGVRFRNANAEIIDDGIDGFLAASDDEFRERLRTLLQSPEVLKGAGEAARSKVLRSRTWDRHVDRYEQLFSEIVADGRV